MIIGIVLVAGLALWLMYGIDLVPKISFKDDKASTENAEPRKLPELEVYTRPNRNKTPEPDTESETLTGMDAGSDSGEQPATDVESVPDRDPIPTGDERPVSNRTNKIDARFERWLTTAPIDELVEECLRLDREWKRSGDDHPYVFMLLRKRKAASERLLEMDLSDTQLRFATVNYLESLSVLDSTNIHGKLGSTWVRGELLENAEKYLDHEEQEIASLAHLSIMAIPGYEFINRPSMELLNLFAERMEEHHEEILKSNNTAQKMAELIVLIYTSKSLRSATRQFAEREIHRFKDLTSDEGKLIYQQLQDQLYFGRLDLPTIVDRVSTKQPRIDADVLEFFSELEKFPNTSLEVHQCALDVIREYIRQERKPMAQQLTQRINDNVIPNITNEENRQKVKEATEEFEAFL